jgi:MFS family permease
MLTTVLCAIALSTAIVNLPPGAFYWLVGLTTLLASMLSPLYALGVGQTNDYVSKNDFVAASAGLLFAWGLGAILGPIAAAPAMSVFNDPNGLFYFIGTCHVLLAAFILYRMIARRALSANEQSNYVAVDAAHASSGKELDPRAPAIPTAGQASRIISATAD